MKWINQYNSECAKFRGSRAIVSWCLRESEIFFSWVFRGFETFSRGYFMGSKFFLVGISWVRKFLDFISLMNILTYTNLTVHVRLIWSLTLILIFIVFNVNSFYRTDVLKLNYWVLFMKKNFLKNLKTYFI